MTFKKAEMAKILKNGLSMLEMNPLNHNWSDFMILTGLTLHQFKKKLLLINYFIKKSAIRYAPLQVTRTLELQMVTTNRALSSFLSRFSSEEKCSSDVLL